MECPIGLELIFYDSLKNIESVLVADYGNYFTKSIIRCTEKCGVYNKQNDTLFAEELLIDFAKDSIYSKNAVAFK